MKQKHYSGEYISGQEVNLPNGRKIGVYRNSDLFVIIAARRAGWCQIEKTAMVLSAEAFSGLLRCAESLLNEE